MWEDNYIGSLTLLPGTLAELGATVKPESVSLERDVEDILFPASVAVMGTCALAILYSLEFRNFFHILNNLSGIARKVESVLAVTHTWQETRFVYQVERVLKPIHSFMSRLAPKKARETLLAMKNFLVDTRGLDWDAHNCLGLLPVLHKHLEELQPGSRLDSLQALQVLLWTKSRHLTWLAVHPLTGKKLGRWNVFAQLNSIRKEVSDAATNGFLLVEMQKLHEKLDNLQAVDFQDVDLYD